MLFRSQGTGTGGTGDSGYSSSMSSLVAVNPLSNATTTAKPKRASSILSALLNQQQEQQSTSDNVNSSFNNSNDSTENAGAAAVTPSMQPSRTDSDGQQAIAAESVYPILSSSLTGLEILQQHRGPWIALSKHRSLPEIGERRVGKECRP